MKVGEGLTLDGALLKKVASGGDQIRARLLYHNATRFRLQGRLLMCANDMPDCQPDDALETVLSIPFQTTFCADPKYEGEREAGMWSRSCRRWATTPPPAGVQVL